MRATLSALAVTLAMTALLARPSLREAEAATTITIASVADVEARRAQLRALLWPTGYPSERRFDIIGPPYLSDFWAAVSNLAEVRQFWVVQAYGVNVAAWHFRPAVSNNRAIIIHHGHQPGPENDPNWRRIHGRFIQAGYDVMAVTMPLMPPNPTSVVVGGRTIALHDDMQMLRTLTLHPFAPFLEPTIAAINYLKDVTGRPTVHMTGLSGGGWTTTLMAAIEPRIIRSYPVAGSLPLASRIPADLGDYEQHDAEVYGLASYEDLYIMAAVGPGRGQIQILNEDDGCCFRVSDRPAEAFAYVDAVRQRATDLGGSWQFFVVPDQFWHDITDIAIDRILTDQGVAIPPTWTPTPTITPTPTQTPVPAATWTPTATRTLPPTSTPMPVVPPPTATPFVWNGSCAPRPPVAVRSAPIAGGLSVTVTAYTPISRIDFGPDRNATISGPAISGTTAMFTVTRAGPGPYTVPFTVHDGCGAWQTFVGQGS